MGKFDFEFPAELTRQLERMENYDSIAPRILNATITILERNVKKELGKHTRTKELLNSIKVSKPKKNQYGWFVCVRPTGKSETIMIDGKVYNRKEPESNMKIMTILEYGSPSQKRPPIPIMTKATNDSRPEVERRMQEEYEKAVSGG
ncbi:hypothetical protein [Cuneatibacter caecimuris]|uniref:HK97 gp10 family phage protein n=1 Tax=Cuneatibacter caecimuris TaxID=1796618 RepID=A0A4Q7PJN9_9FIRM|nr:hypothetical protein [Cuneatibacter caecimuris]RZT00903.1 hypothetical protein EV209_1339 [Cuneatibacter caecimuris]